MDDGEGGLSFDFEGGLETGPMPPTASNPSAQPLDASAAAVLPAGNNITINPSAPQGMPAVADGGGMRRSFRQTVCRHWLRSLCMKGDACGFLHQYDKSRMPVCRFFRLYGECREQDCVYKHTNEDIKECNMYKLGFCPNGPDCRYRHAKLPGPPPPVEEILQKIQQLTSYGYNGTNRFFQNRNPNYNQQTEKTQFPQGSNGVNQVVKATNSDSPNMQQQVQQSQQQVTQVQAQSAPGGPQNPANMIGTPLPQGPSRYFIVKSSNRDNLELSVQQGVWATQRSNEAKLNEAFDSVENVILIFSVNRTRHFQGCAKMTSRIGGSVSGGNWKHSHGTAHYGRNFSLKWLKLCELSFHKTRHLRNPYNENLPVKISRDCQEMEPSIGEQLASLMYLEPDSELMAVWQAAETKREEERAKGLNSDNKSENPDIVPFEDNEEEEEEESDEEDESYNQVFGGPTGLGRGRGRGVGPGGGMLWPPMMRGGARPMPPGMRGFPPGMMGGGDGFSYNDGFSMPDMYGMGPRGFVPYGPRFPGDFPGQMYPGRPGGGGFGMMMGGPGPARGPPFMAGPGRPIRPGGGGGGGGGGVPLFPQMQQSQPPLGRGKRDHKVSQEMSGSGNDEGKYQQRTKTEEEEQFGDDSESEDEAPRRSRHGEGRKKRRNLEGDATVTNVTTTGTIGTNVTTTGSDQQN